MSKLRGKNLYILRHEKRPFNVGYKTELTNSGKKDASLSLQTLISCQKIDAVYSSPFVRTLQTVYPYCKKHNKKVRCDNGLYEFLNFGSFERTHSLKEIEDKELLSIVDNEYNSLIKVDGLKGESPAHMKNRIQLFVNYILNTKDKNILIVSHQSVVEEVVVSIAKAYGKKWVDHLDYPMGGLSRLCEDADGALVFEMMNKH